MCSVDKTLVGRVIAHWRGAIAGVTAHWNSRSLVGLKISMGRPWSTKASARADRALSVPHIHHGVCFCLLCIITCSVYTATIKAIKSMKQRLICCAVHLVPSHRTDHSHRSAMQCCRRRLRWQSCQASAYQRPLLDLITNKSVIMVRGWWCLSPRLIMVRGWVPVKQTNKRRGQAKIRHAFNHTAHALTIAMPMCCFRKWQFAIN